MDVELRRRLFPLKSHLPTIEENLLLQQWLSAVLGSELVLNQTAYLWLVASARSANALTFSHSVGGPERALTPVASPTSLTT